MRYFIQTTLVSSMMALSGMVWADVVPNAGQLLQQQQPLQPHQPQTQVQLETAQQNTPALDQQQTIQIQQIRIVGNQSFRTEQLHALVADAEGKTLTLAQLQQLCQRVSQYYQQHGYPYSRAYLPAQTLSNGQVTIAILEATYDQIQYNNQSRISPKLVEKTLAPLHSGDVIDGKTLEQQIKLLNRLDGVKTRNIIQAGQKTGSSDLMVDIQPTPLFTGYVGADNYGNEYTREARFNAGIAAHNLLGLGDQLSLDAMTSGKLNYGRLGYEATVNGQGTRLGASYSDLSYKLGKEYKVLDAKGNAQQASLWLTQPVLLTNQSEVLLTAQYDYKRLEDDIEQVDVYRHRDLHIGQLRLNATQYDDFASGGLNQLGVATEIGHVNYKNALAKKNDQATAQTQGEFYSVSANLSRLQNLGSTNTQLYTAIQAQYSPDNLDSSEQFSVGGAYTVAGYENSVLSGSSGYYAVAELRQNLWSTAQNQLIGKVYIDTAEVQHQAKPWAGLTGDNREQIHSAGIGFNWANASQWTAQAKVGFAIGGQPDSVDEKHDAETWLVLSKHF